MELSDVRYKIIEIFETVGILIDDEIREDKKMDIDLSELLSNSIQWISIITELESVFDIAWPDDLLILENLKSLNVLTNTTLELINEKENRGNNNEI